MRLHGNAKTAPYTRELMVRRVLKQAEPVRNTAAAFGVSKTTLYKWLRRYREDGVAGLEDRSSRPHTSPRQTPAGVVHRILKLRRHRLTAWEISAQLSVPASTVSQWLRRQGVGRLRDLEPKPPVQRYERASLGLPRFPGHLWKPDNGLGGEAWGHDGGTVASSRLRQ